MRVGINGFGRIGQTVLRILCDLKQTDVHSPVVAGINGGSSAKNMAHLLKFDSLHGVWPQKVSYNDNHLLVNDLSPPVCHTRNPLEIPWDQWEVDVVLECTGAFKTRQDLQKHIKGSVKKVLISAPAKGSDITICYGINHKQYDSQQHQFISNASCTTNCLAPLAKVLDDQFGIISGFMTTVHAYTNDQRLLDGQHKDLRRGRAAGLSMIPTTTGAAKTVGEVLPDLKGKIDGISVRVPTPNVSLVDFVAHLKSTVSIDDVNQAFVKASKKELQGILAIEDLPLVSRDFLGHTASCIVDLPSTMVLSDQLGGVVVKVLAWYDNEVGFSYRMIDLLQELL